MWQENPPVINFWGDQSSSYSPSGYCKRDMEGAATITGCWSLQCLLWIYWRVILRHVIVVSCVCLLWGLTAFCQKLLVACFVCDGATANLCMIQRLGALPMPNVLAKLLDSCKPDSYGSYIIMSQSRVTTYNKASFRSSDKDACCQELTVRKVCTLHFWYLEWLIWVTWGMKLTMCQR